MDQSYFAIFLAGGSAGDYVDSRHNFEGIGPTMSAEKRSACWHGLSLFTNLRGSVLYGDSSAVATDEDDDFITRVNPGDMIAIGEMQIGVDWRKHSCYGVLFAEAALEAQYWLNAGTAAPGHTEDDDQSYQDEGAQSPDMGFLGGTFSVGILY
jgi:hypothetical protein